MRGQGAVIFHSRPTTAWLIDHQPLSHRNQIDLKPLPPQCTGSPSQLITVDTQIRNNLSSQAPGVTVSPQAL